MCIATMKTMTMAIKARGTLESAGISATIVHLDPTLTRRGCAFGIRFPCEKTKDVTRLLENRHITWGDILGSAQK